MTVRHCGMVVLGLVLLAMPFGVQAQRVSDGLIVLYEFNEGQGTTVGDTSGVGDPLDLFIDDRDLGDGLIEWGNGFVSINRGSSESKTDGTLAPIESNAPADKLYDAIVNPDTDGTEAFTVEAWVTPERDGSPGLELDSNPARMVSMSQDHSFRNFTLGQELGDRWVSRVRTSESGRNGTGAGVAQMETDPGSVVAEALTHVVLTRDNLGTETLYFNISGQNFGEFVTRDIFSELNIDDGTNTTAGGDPGATDWNPDYGLALGDETNVAERKWVGDFHLVAIYNEALNFAQVQQNFAAGPDGGAAPSLRAGDADQDLDFDQIDLVQVQIAAKYLSGQAATWGEGDWDGAPGGSQGAPPAGNGMFDQLDIIAALAAGAYLKGPYAALRLGGQTGDDQTSIGYDPSTGEVWVDAPAGNELTSINIDSAGSIFTGAAAENLGGSFDNDSDNNIFKATFGSSFGSLSFGNVAQTGLSYNFVLNDLTVVGSLAGGGDLGTVDLIPIPEPSGLVLMLLAALAMGINRGFWRRA